MILHDTNILIYGSNSAAPQHGASAAVLRASYRGAVPGVLVPQVLVEFYSVVTQSRRVPMALTPVEAWEAIESFRTGLPLLYLQSDAITRLGELTMQRLPVGRSVFDLFLVAQMRSHGIGQICTYNVADFSGIAGIEALTPEQALVRYGISPAPQV